MHQRRSICDLQSVVLLYAEIGDNISEIYDTKKERMCETTNHRENSNQFTVLIFLEAYSYLSVLREVFAFASLFNLLRSVFSSLSIMASAVLITPRE
mmetsp:Transcript_33052/g.63159  ORF Transcript_33052/g.63159 Transcript_33052/m.63159 type:complete len:97 (+) Transcript_33052:314-604(+)